jgi:hypothetical protein
MLLKANHVCGGDMCADEAKWYQSVQELAEPPLEAVKVAGTPISGLRLPISKETCISKDQISLIHGDQEVA